MYNELIEAYLNRYDTLSTIYKELGKDGIIDRYNLEKEFKTMNTASKDNDYSPLYHKVLKFNVEVIRLKSVFEFLLPYVPEIKTKNPDKFKL